MQGVKSFIKTEDKISYINQLLKVGFHTLDFGSFVSPKAIPQMADTHDVIQSIDVSGPTRLSAIVANTRGAMDAIKYEAISLLGYPFSISETFQIRNTNATIEESLQRISEINNIARSNGKELVAYLSMGFGNPYGDPWNVDIVKKWVDILASMQINYICLSDTIGVSDPENIAYLYANLIPEFPEIEIGAHLHTTPSTWKEKIEAAYNSGCYRFDGAIRGFGGCPMAKDELVGNMPMEHLIHFMKDQNINLNLDTDAFLKAYTMAAEVFPDDHSTT